MASNLHFVGYPDGGCRGLQCNSGAGLHGYFYEEGETGAPVEVKLRENKDGEEVLACTLKNDTPTTYGYIHETTLEFLVAKEATVVKPVEFIDYALGIKDGTNNIGELLAAIKCFEIALERDVLSLTIGPDAKYVIDGITRWLAGWKAGNWIKKDGNPVANLEHWKRIDALITELKAKNVRLSIHWVPGHSGHLGNELADEYATRGVVMAAKSDPNLEFIKFTPAKGYFNHKSAYNRLFHHPCWYFATQATETHRLADGRAVYYCGNEDEFRGKCAPTCSNSVLYLKNPEPSLEAVRDYQNQLDEASYGTMFIGYLDTIFSARMGSEFSEFGTRFLTRADVRPNIMHEPLGNQLITREQRPPCQAWNAEANLQALKNRLDEFEAMLSAGETEPSLDQSKLVLTEITDQLYEVDTSKKKAVTKLSPLVSQTTQVFTVSAKYNIAGGVEETPLRLTVGLDVPKRNTLAAIATEDTRAWIITWRESSHGFRYATIFKVGEDTIITSAVYANLKAIV